MNITKKQIHNIVLEELEILLKESQLQDEGIFDLLRNKKNPTRSADDDAALAALQTMPSSVRNAAKDVKVTGYKDLASKEQGKPTMKKTKSYSLEEGEDYPAPSRMKKLVAQAKLNARYQPNDMDQLKKDYDKYVRNTLRDPKHADAHKRE